MSYDTSNSDEGSVVSTEFAEYRVDVAADDFVTRSRISRGRTGHRRSASFLFCVFLLFYIWVFNYALEVAVSAQLLLNRSIWAG